MTSFPKTMSGRTPYLERVEAGGATETMTVDERLVAMTDPHGAAAEQYRMLLHRLRHARSLRGDAADPSRGGAVIAVTSSVRGEGVSLTAANLALTAARSGARVALVDCDLRRGSAALLFGMGVRAGLAEVLAGKNEIGEALGNYHEGKLAIVPAGKAPAESAALLASPRFAQTLSLLRQLFDEIYLDVPPALATADAAVVVHKADGVVLVVRAEQTAREHVASAVRSLAGAPLWGMVLNGVDPSRVPAPLPVVRGQLSAGR